MTSFLITAATEMAISIDDARAAARVDEGSTSLDDELTAAVMGITQDAESRIDQCIMPQTWRVQVEAFPAAGLVLPHPAKSIASAKYIDADGNVQDLTQSDYRIVVSRYESVLLPKSGTVIPTTDGSPDGFKVDVVCGIATTAADLPADIKLYIELRLRQQFDPATRLERDTVQSNFIDNILNPYVVNP